MNALTDLPKIPKTDVEVEFDIRAIATASSRAEKEHNLAVLASSEDGRRIIDWCYNPFITFGVTCKKQPPLRSDADVESWSELPLVHNLLTSLASREFTGNAAKEAIDSAFKNLNASAATILWLCLNKDLKAGVAEASINSVCPNLIPTFAVMRAQTYEEKLVKKFPVAVEPKKDGNRVSFITRDGSGGFFTRTGKVIASLEPMVPVLLDAVRQWFGQTRIGPVTDPVMKFTGQLLGTNHIPNLMLDGEMMSVLGFDAVNGALNAKDDRTEGLSFHIFDCLSWEEFDAVGDVKVPYVERRQRVNSIILCASGLGYSAQIKQTPIQICNSHEEIHQAYADQRALGEEGAMVKDPQGFYEKKKSRSWLKLKAEENEDLPVIGVFQGQAGGKYESTIGGLIVDRNGVEVRVSGISDVDRAAIWDLWVQTANACGFSPEVGFKGASFKSQIEACEVPTILLGRLIEVEFHEALVSGSLRHPRFVKFRDDKMGEVDK